MDAGQRVERDMREVYDYWARGPRRLIARANQWFMQAVRPAVAYAEEPGQEEIDLVRQCFMEWFAYECVLDNGLTPLETYVASEAVHDESDRLDRLGQVESTNLFSQFAIDGKDAEAGTSSLRDIYTGVSYLVHDARLARTERWLPGFTVAMRIASVDGAWCFAGLTHLVDRAPYVPGSGYLLGMGYGGERGDGAPEGLFLRAVTDLIGVDGRMRPTARAIYQ